MRASVEAEPLQVTLEAEIGHHGRDHGRLGEPAVLHPALRDHGEQLVAVDQVALLVDDHDAVGVAVERDADVGAHLAHLAGERLGRGRAAILVDVEAVRLDAEREHLGAELPQRRGRDAVGGAVGAVDHDAHAVELERARQRALGELDVAVLHAVDALGAADLLRAWRAAWRRSESISSSICFSISSDSL